MDFVISKTALEAEHMVFSYEKVVKDALYIFMAGGEIPTFVMHEPEEEDMIYGFSVTLYDDGIAVDDQAILPIKALEGQEKRTDYDKVIVEWLEKHDKTQFINENGS